MFAALSRGMTRIQKTFTIEIGPIKSDRHSGRIARRYRRRFGRRRDGGIIARRLTAPRNARCSARNCVGNQQHLAAVASVIADNALRELIRSGLPDADVTIHDRTGTHDHFNVRVRSNAFTGKTLIQQHQLVYRALKAALADGRVHAVELTTIIAEN